MGTEGHVFSLSQDFINRAVDGCVMPVLDAPPFCLDVDRILTFCGFHRGNRRIETIIQELIETVLPVARPKALYRVAYVEKREGDSVYIDGVYFTSHVLRVNLEAVERIFPYAATCGTELDQIHFSPRNYVKQYYLDGIKELALRSATHYLAQHLQKTYALTQISRMNPGSLEDWPLSQQNALFTLLGDVPARIGIALTKHCVMTPIKSVSGIYFPTQIRFESCRLCPRRLCRRRRAPYDPDVVKTYASPSIEHPPQNR